MVSGEICLENDIKGKIDIVIRLEGGVFNLNTRIKWLYDVQLYGIISTVRRLVEQLNFKNIYIELVIKNTVAKVVKEAFSKL